jgi:hypothetical protein
MIVYILHDVFCIETHLIKWVRLQTSVYKLYRSFRKMSELPAEICNGPGRRARSQLPRRGR